MGGAMTPDRATLRCEIFPADLDVTVAFYVGVLAFQVVRGERGSAFPYGALRRGAVPSARRPGCRSLRGSTGGRRWGSSLLEVDDLEVDDLDVDRARVDAAGWPVTEEITERSWGLRDFRLLDS